ncbi:hypothetical protein [Streptomyces sp. YS415]|uniref:hypothetical protein n=1 Tax=Streptomyces sp. YS415 TaxID=2944806 RepID=UPI002021E2F4|nr:hypothetical protein [Streptomyces sp. YS415]MCL7429401.1 hypothetical protein [Streptomyces sp. YS415]
MDSTPTPTGRQPGRNNRRTISGDDPPARPAGPRRPAVRQAVSLPAVAGDPDEQLGRLEAQRRGARSTTEPAPRTGTGDGEAVSGREEAPGEATRGEEGNEPEPPTRTASRGGGWRRLTRAGSDRTASSQSGAAASAQAPSAVTGGASAGTPSAAAGGARTGTAARTGAASPHGDTDTATAGDPQTPRGTGGNPDGQGDDGRPKKPMLAAAALAGVVLIAVPLLLAGTGDDERRQTTAGASQDTLLAGGDGTGDELGNFVADPSSDEADAKGKPGAEGKPGADEEGTDGAHSGAGLGDDTVPNGPPEPDSFAVTGEGGSGNGGADTGAADDAPARPDQDDTSQGGDSDGESQPAADDTPQLKSELIQAWEKGSHRLTNQQTGKCLVRTSTRSVAQGSCGSGDTWRRYSVASGTWLLKHVGANRCLDTDGKQLYLSSCTVKDAGQIWRLPTADCAVNLVSKAFGTYVTGWNDGTASATTRSAVDQAAKYRWRAPQLTGC